MPPIMHPVVQRMHQYNRLLADYLSGVVQAPALSVFADERNWIQHQLLSLPSQEEIHFGNQAGLLLPSKAVYEVIRISLLLYSLLVIFPIPFEFGPFTRLRVMLQRALADPSVGRELPSEVLLWVVTIASLPWSVEGRGWFQNALQGLTSHMSWVTWEEAKLVLGSVMWQDSVLDSMLAQVWPHSPSLV